MKNSYFVATLVACVAFCFSIAGCRHDGGDGDLRSRLEKFVAGKEARTGIAVIVDGHDTIEVNGHCGFPMLSVYKFPIALAVGEQCRRNGYDLEESRVITGSEMLPDTYSPMRERYAGADSVRLTLRELLTYALQQSDNNASDILLSHLGGTGEVMRHLRDIGAAGINVVSTEAEMHADTALCRINSATPVAIAALFDRFAATGTDSISAAIKGIIETCATGTDRLAAPLEGTGAVIGHKTGTGFTMADGRLMAVNDAGYVLLPDGRRYSVAVFVENSRLGMEDTSALIAEISSIILSGLGGVGGFE